MPVNTNISSVTYVGPVKTREAVSRWSDVNKLSRVYENNASREDPQMRKADNLLFDPKEMLVGTSKGMYETDVSQMRVDRDRMWTPVIYTAGGLILFLIVVSFLRKN